MEKPRNTETKHTVCISADTHIGTFFQDFTEYFDPKFREEYIDSRNQLMALVGDEVGEDALAKIFDLISQSDSDTFNVIGEILRPDVVKRQHDDRRKFLKQHLGDEGSLTALSTGGEGDPIRQIKELEADGTVGSICLPLSNPWGFAKDVDTKKAIAGAEAVNRWVADFVSHSPEQHAGTCVAPLDAGIDAAIEQVRWASENGLRGGLLLDTNPEIKGLPLYNAKFWDPLWEACADLGMPVNLHAGAGPKIPKRGGQVLWMIDNRWYMSRPMRYFLVGGVFERHPKLKVTMIECNAAWAAEELRLLDAVCSGEWEQVELADRQFFQLKINHDDSDVDWKVHMLRTAKDLLSKQPSEYFRSNMWLSITAHPDEWLSREYLGVDRLMWGSDYPHNESTWPHSMEQVKKTVDKLQITEDEVQKIMAANAAEVWGFDLAKLQPIANKAGPIFY